MKKLSALLLALVLTLGLALPVLADDASVLYSGHDIFGFGPGSEFTATDLFPNFKSAMPGDVLTQTVTVGNAAACCDFVKIYLRAKVHDEAANPLSPNVAQTEDLVSITDFLSKLTLTVWNGEELIYQASPDQTHGLTQNALLGTFRQGQGATLTVRLEVPADLGNEYARRVGEVDWIFLVEEYDDADPENPKTGDHEPVLLLVLVMALSLLAIAALILLRRKKKNP